MAIYREAVCIAAELNIKQRKKILDQRYLNSEFLIYPSITGKQAFLDVVGPEYKVVSQTKKTLNRHHLAIWYTRCCDLLKLPLPAQNFPDQLVIRTPDDMQSFFSLLIKEMSGTTFTRMFSRNGEYNSVPIFTLPYVEGNKQYTRNTDLLNMARVADTVYYIHTGKFEIPHNLNDSIVSVEVSPTFTIDDVITYLEKCKIIHAPIE